MLVSAPLWRYGDRELTIGAGWGWGLRADRTPYLSNLPRCIELPPNRGDIQLIQSSAQIGMPRS